MTANHIPLSGAFQEKLFYKREERNMLTDLPAMLFINKHLSLVRDYDKTPN